MSKIDYRLTAMLSGLVAAEGKQYKGKEDLSSWRSSFTGYALEVQNQRYVALYYYGDHEHKPKLLISIDHRFFCYEAIADILVKTVKKHKEHLDNRKHGWD